MIKISEAGKASTYECRIYIAGDLGRIKELCQEFAWRGLCVTVTPTTYVYTGGREEGAVVGLMNYPRFPTQREELDKSAKHLAKFLLGALYQKTCSVVTPDVTFWLTRTTKRDSK